METKRDYITGEILAVDKPYGWTSFEVVHYIKRALCKRLGLKDLKVGHAGTLDPLATGMLLVATGKKTKLLTQLSGATKTYEVELRLGYRSVSSDMEKPLEDLHIGYTIPQKVVEKILNGFICTYRQRPPLYSAVSVEGQRSYKLVRLGFLPALKRRDVTIYDISLQSYDITTGRIRLTMTCSKGTYVRAFVRDYGQVLTTGAYVVSLRRIAVGDYTTMKPLRELLS